MKEPKVSRPYMPGYGTVGPDEGGGLLDWGWAEMRLRQSHEYWVASVWPDGRPHVMPVWGAWNQDAFWFSGSNKSRKVRNLKQNPNITVTTDDASSPVVLEGSAELITNRALIAIFLNRTNSKYQQNYGIEFLDPDVNATFRVFPKKVIGLEEANFTGSPTRWEF
jgi:general stress protein 26